MRDPWKNKRMAFRPSWSPSGYGFPEHIWRRWCFHNFWCQVAIAALLGYLTPPVWRVFMSYELDAE